MSNRTREQQKEIDELREIVHVELRQLQTRIAKLETFIEENATFTQLTRTEQDIMQRQLIAMEHYRNALLARIGLWTLTETKTD